MTQIPTIAFAGYSGSGKTTIIEKIICNLKARGVRVAVIKHDAHDFKIDYEGKDSWRYSTAGSDITIISSSNKTAYIAQREYTLTELLNMVHDVDLILVEGYKNQNLPQIGVARIKNGKGFPHPIQHYLAIMTDFQVRTDIPQFCLDDAEGITKFILKYACIPYSFTKEE